MLSPDELAFVADELPVAIWMGRAPSGEVVYTNRAFREVLGIEPPPGAARGTFVEPYGVHLLDGRPYPEDQMPFERALAARATVMLDDLVIHRRDGRRVNLRVFAKPVFDAHGEITHILEAFTDITREVEAENARIEGERKIARAQRMQSIGELVIGIAHDFNNLLTVTALTTARLLANDPPPQVRTALADIDTVTSSATELVKKLLGFSRRDPQPLAPVDLASLARSVVGFSQRTFDRRLTLVIDCDAQDTWIRGDQTQLEQVLMNLLVNARDAIGDRGGTIVVSTRVKALTAGQIETCPAGTYIVLEVTDDGPGIDPAIIDRVFEPYVTTKTRGPVKGTGLGLSTVLGIVRTHDGHIEARPASPRGTTLRIAFPAYEQPALPAATASEGPRPHVRGGGQLVLVVDDEPLVRSATAHMLSSLGYRALEAQTGPEAIELFTRQVDQIAAVILDVVMPGIPTAEVFDAFRQRRAETPVVLVTGGALGPDLEALQARGVRATLVKPFEVGKLAELMASLVS